MRNVKLKHKQMTKAAYPTIDQPGAYLSEILRHYNFWMSLAQIDLRNRFRRTSLGIIWVVIQPFMFTLILSLIFHFVFKRDFFEFSVYVFSGITLWVWFSESVILGANSITHSQAFIRQRRLPLAIYSMRTFIVSLLTYLLSFAGLLVWLLLTGHVPGLYALLLPLNILFIGMALFPLVVFSGVIGTLYRDYQQFSQIILQALWFLSPVFMDKSVFLNPGLNVWDYFNPVSNMLELIRKPLIENMLPTWENYLFAALFGLAGWALAYLFLKRHEKRLIYYL